MIISQGRIKFRKKSTLKEVKLNGGRLHIIFSELKEGNFLLCTYYW